MAIAQARLPRILTVTAVFLFLTLLLTYPLILHMGTTVRDIGDPLLNTWIMSWNMESILHGRISGFFDANIFYPQTRTLAYSEFLLPQSLIALPAKLATGNPIFAHNFVLLFVFLTTGLGMYALARFLTGNTVAGIAAGMIFAFSPFMMSHLFQVQVLTAAGIPLAFLFLHKFFSQGRMRDLLLFSLFFVVQALANGYFALYLLVFAGLYILIFVFVRKKYGDSRFWLKMGLAVLLVLICLGPFYYQYYRVQQEMGFSRGIQCAANLKSYLATTSINNLYGKITARFMQSERALFPGVVPFLLGCLGAGFFLKLKKRTRSAPSISPGSRLRLKRAVLWVVTAAWWLYAGVLVSILGWDGFDLKLAPLGVVHAHNLAKAAALTLLLGALVLILRSVWAMRLLPFALDWDSPWIYVLILSLAFFLTFGPYGPYPLLYRYVPGFNGLRVAARFHIFFMFGLAVLAAYGIAGLGRFLSRAGKKTAVLAVLPLLILVEYLSVPVPYSSVPVKDGIPAVYQWLSHQPGDFAVVEFPLPNQNRIPYIECRRVYYSAYHWKKLVDGYSGFFPTLFWELMWRYSVMPLNQVVQDLKALGVRMIVAHTDEMQDSSALPELVRLASLGHDLREVSRYDGDIVYELVYRPGENAAPAGQTPPALLPRDSWTAAASTNAGQVSKAFDGSLKTSWDGAGPQKKGQWFRLDLGQPEYIRGVSLRLGPDLMNYPRGLRAEVSTDSVHWQTVGQIGEVVVPIQTLIHPANAAVILSWPPVEARSLRLVQTGEDPAYHWLINEIEVWSGR